MSTRYLLGLVTFGFAAQLSAQDPASIAPQAYRTQFENEIVKVTRVHYAPHETLAEHAHPARPSIFVYLNDGGPVLFKHEHGESGEYGATRPATKAGAYRLATSRSETHIVENRSDLSSDFLQIELKTPVDPKGFSGRRFRAPADEGRAYANVEFETSQMQIVRIGCPAHARCDPPAAASNPRLLILLSGKAFDCVIAGDTKWLPPHVVAQYDRSHAAAFEFLLIDFRTP